MPRFLYTVWFRDELAAADDQDCEWPACFVVEAQNATDAHSWGDHLARSFGSRRRSETFLHSQVEAHETASASSELPVVAVGYEATDAEIGW